MCEKENYYYELAIGEHMSRQKTAIPEHSHQTVPIRATSVPATRTTMQRHPTQEQLSRMAESKAEYGNDDFD